MYPKYFGLSEASFSITPDPQYLFLSEQHREALAHLLYGAGEGGGFVLLSGEVGTGKTTICRAFLEQLPAEVDVALILNPAVSAIELLRAICDEFRIRVPEQERTTKQLVDRINDFLLQAHANGRRPVLMIDEAQNLRPKVLEQIRLLTNLETPKQKLLQVFLVGQPELRTLLASPGLRQLDQRITARFHLKPLNAQGTGDYIRHRLAVGGVQRPLFTAGAIRRVHAISGGIPRLINILCDRALLGTYVSRSAQVTPAIVEKAAREVQGEAYLAPRPRRPGKLLIAAGLAVALVAGWWVRGWLEAGGERRIGELAAQWLPSRPFNTAPAASKPQVPGVSQPADDPEAAGTASDPKPPLAADLAHTPPVQGGIGAEAGTGGTSPVSAPEPAPTASLVQVAAPGGSPESVGAAQTLGSGPASPAGVTSGTTEPAVAAPDATPVAPPVVTAPLAPMPPPAAAQEPPSVPAAPVDPRTLGLAEPEAMRLLLALWGLNLNDLGPGDSCDRLPAYGLACERDRGTWRELYALDRPALLKLRPRRGQGRGSTYVVLTGLDAETVILSHPTGAHRVPRADLKQLLSGSFTLVWQPPPVGTTIIRSSSKGEAVRWLRKLLSQVPELGVTDTESGTFDASVGAAVRRFQVKYGLNPDGQAGPKTLIQLNNAVGMPGIPKLSKGP